jgi:hypothetical protein
MSLTSYRAAPPRDSCAFFALYCRFVRGKRRVGPGWSPMGLGLGGYEIVLRATGALAHDLSVLIRFGGDLLSHDLSRSTIGAVALNGRVRDGIGCFAHAVTTKPGKNSYTRLSCFI